MNIIGLTSARMWHIFMIIIGVLFVLAVVSLMRKSFQISVLLFGICIALFIFGNVNIGPFFQTIVNKGTQIVEDISGQSEDELKQRGEEAIDDIKDTADKISSWVKE